MTPTPIAHAITVIQQAITIASPVTVSLPNRIELSDNISPWIKVYPGIVSALIGALVALVGVWFSKMNDRQTRNIELVITNGRNKYEKLYPVTRQMLTVMARFTDLNDKGTIPNYLTPTSEADYKLFREQCLKYHDMWVASTSIQRDNIFILMSYFQYLITTKLTDSGKIKGFDETTYSEVITDMIKTTNMTVELLNVVCHKHLLDSLDMGDIKIDSYKLLLADMKAKKEFESVNISELDRRKRELEINALVKAPLIVKPKS